MTEITRREAATILQSALAEVFEPQVVGQLREDSVLAALGMSMADAVCVSDAAAVTAKASGWEVNLGDADFSEATTVADLVGAVQRAAAREGSRDN